MNIDIITKYFGDISDEQCRQLEAVYDLYQDWNSKINVISTSDQYTNMRQTSTPRWRTASRELSHII